MRDRILSAIKRIEKVLREAATKQFPGREPREWPESGDGASPSQGDGGSPSLDPTESEQELEDLLEIDSSRAPGRRAV